MGIFFGKNYAQVFFKTDDAGRWVFYRYGRFGKGYVVEPAQEREIETYIGRQFGWATALLFLQIAGQTALGIGTTLAILGIPYLVFLILFFRGLSRRIRGLPVSELRMTGADVVRNQAAWCSSVLPSCNPCAS